MLQNVANKLGVEDLKLDPRWTLLGLAGLAIVLALLVVFYLWRDNVAFQPLYGAGESFPAAEVMQALDDQRIRYRVHPQSGQVMVREDQLGEARMSLATQGIQVSVPPGYELFDRDEPLGRSQFVQNVRLRRSIEGELARTVMALQGIEQARVHLAQEENNSFVVSNRNPPKASVMVQLRQGHRLAPEQVNAITNLIANSVPGLEPKDVSVVDQYGTLLSRGAAGWGGPTQNWGIVEEYQEKAVSNIEKVLAPIVGHGNYRISVAADIDFSQREETSQLFGEEGRLRNEILNNETVFGQLALGIPGSLANLPANQGAAAGNEENEGNNPSAVSEQAQRRLDYDQTISHVRYPSFELRRQSVSVVLNAQTGPEGGWTPELREELAATITSAVAFNEARGDVLTLNVFPFAPVEMPVQETIWWQDPDVHALVRLGLAGLLGLFLIMLAARAIRAARPTPLPAPEQIEEEEEQEPAAMPEALVQQNERKALANRQVFSELNPLAEIPLPDPSSGLELQIEHLRMLTENDPERVAEIIKHWIGRNERDRKPTV
ncbi:flagellar M-ring protein FliF [Alkalilimnicola ehrlichii]|uniref:Flagellar M-ring protein n=1 Tax=Alkalilimnicola ehrlichii TaxID=351052 RepID=A0A3E0X1E6_9GAMM|nr:flagellar basal-body MS-ring/collar protein FliF [Alkalilimnicola ehrlichii]RFA30721.1 flagellar M-ring protein FliF [Alkalilimnicola ehrlichii]RFA38297.1 flagellar M-ring protein FliF [Alkalilimnicola ehrlichii]